MTDDRYIKNKKTETFVKVDKEKLDIRREILANFSAKIKEFRSEIKMSQFDLAVKADLSLSFVSKIEQGISNISLVQIHALANALEVDIISLVASTTIKDQNM